MGAKGALVAAITCDIIDSRRYTGATRQKLNDGIQRAFASITANKTELDVTKIDFRITAGDEFQFILRKPERSLDVVTFLRSTLAVQGFKPMARFRTGIGVGEARYRPSKRADQRPYEWDGPAFVFAREGLEAIKRQRSPDRWTALLTSDAALNRRFDVILGLVDHLQHSWTTAQWEAIVWTLKGLNRQEAARRLKVAHQNVSKRLNAAAWPAVEAALALIREELSHPPRGATT